MDVTAVSRHSFASYQVGNLGGNCRGLLDRQCWLSLKMAWSTHTTNWISLLSGVLKAWFC